MKKDFFTYITHCELVITSDEISPDYLTDELSIVPTRFFKKGESTVSKHSKSIIYRINNLWALSSKSSEKEEETINHHIEYFKSVVTSKMAILKKYKEDARFEVTFWVWIQTDNAGIGLDLSESEIEFFHNVCNRVHLSLLSVCP